MKPLAVATAAIAVAAVVIGAMFLRELGVPRRRPVRSQACPRCGIANESGLSRCWSCGGSMPAL